jgi:hypothetical protein
VHLRPKAGPIPIAGSAPDRRAYFRRDLNLEGGRMSYWMTYLFLLVLGVTFLIKAVVGYTAVPPAA